MVIDPKDQTYAIEGLIAALELLKEHGDPNFQRREVIDDMKETIVTSTVLTGQSIEDRALDAVENTIEDMYMTDAQIEAEDQKPDVQKFYKDLAVLRGVI